MGAWDVVWSLYLRNLGASMTFISFTWVAFSVPMLLSVFGGMVADRYSRFWLFFVGYALSSCAWMFYGISTNLDGAPHRQRRWRASPSPSPIRPSRRSSIQVSPRRWIGTVTGVESTAMQLAGLLGLAHGAAPLQRDLRARADARRHLHLRRARRGVARAVPRLEAVWSRRETCRGRPSWSGSPTAPGPRTRASRRAGPSDAPVNARAGRGWAAPARAPPLSVGRPASALRRPSAPAARPAGAPDLGSAGPPDSPPKAPWSPRSPSCGRRTASTA